MRTWHWVGYPGASRLFGEQYTVVVVEIRDGEFFNIDVDGNYYFDKLVPGGEGWELA